MQKREKWELVLLALYAEAIGCGSFAEVTAKTMDMGGGEFGWTLYALQMRGLITGCRFQPPQPSSAGNLMGVLRDGLMLTPQGFQQAEALLDGALCSNFQFDRSGREATWNPGGIPTSRKTTAARLHAVWEILRDTGCAVMASVVYSWLQ